MNYRYWVAVKAVRNPKWMEIQRTKNSEKYKLKEHYHKWVCDLMVRARNAKSKDAHIDTPNG
ncbi:MAG: hypothetical protein KAS32_31210 [Candidatus Peribacteraceae bacterium]|nr:hypothetical protein [Candidatus Peribacteraceae bacterium]